MQLADLLRENLDVENEDVWENERTRTLVRCFAVRLHSMGLSLREVEAVLDWLGVDCCHQAIWYWKETLAESQSDPPTVAPSRVAVDEKQIRVDGDTDGRKFAYFRPSVWNNVTDVFGPLITGLQSGSSRPSVPIP